MITSCSSVTCPLILYLSGAGAGVGAGVGLEELLSDELEPPPPQELKNNKRRY
jgi:hypothetical protein